jgi:signal recognition particle subunit SRP54
MGDVLSLIEKAEQSLDEDKAQEALDRLRQNRFTMQDMLEQLEQIQNMGSIKDLLSMMPGVGSKAANLDVDEEQLVGVRAIIQSMTMAERENPTKVLNASRRKRIASGSGTSVQAVNQVVRQYNDSLKMMKQMGVMGGGRRGKRKRPKFDPSNIQW